MSKVKLSDIRLPPKLIKDLDLETLRSINGQDEATFFEFFQGLDLPDVKAASRQREDQAQKNRQLAVENCELEPKFQEAKERLTRRAIEAAELEHDYKEKFEELKMLQNRTDEATILKDLQEALKSSEKSSEELGEAYISGKTEMSVDNFSQEFFDQRTQYWLRKVKAEKMVELLRNKQPKPIPRSPRSSRAPPVMPPPYLAPLPHSNPAQSLPASGAAPYPPDNRRVSDPAPTPYPPGPNMMPQPGHPFPAAAFTPYQPQPHHSAHYPNHPPPRPPYSGRPPQYGYP